jgi:hypothetical protein
MAAWTNPRSPKSSTATRPHRHEAATRERANVHAVRVEEVVGIDEDQLFR